MARYVIQTYEVSERQACRLLSLSRTVFRYEAQPRDDHEITQELLRLVERQPRWGCSKMVDYLRNQGCNWNHKRIRRVYCELKLNIRRIPKKRLPARTARALAVPEQSNQSWSLDFMSDSLSNGRAFRTLNTLDDYNREALWIELDTSIPAERVIRVLDVLLLWRGTPKQTRMDNGPELISQRLVELSHDHHIELAHIHPGKPAHTAYIERFNRTFREEVLDAYLFDDLQQVRAITEHWLQEYNIIRPHDALQGLTPHQDAIQHA